MTHWLFSRLSADTAENSIMQTITIAVSAILIAAGLITAPGLINNARDNNTREDLTNIAYAQETALATADGYFGLRPDGQPALLKPLEGIKYTTSATSSAFKSYLCGTPTQFLIEAKSATGKTFYRSSGRAGVVSDLSKLTLPKCITDQMPADPLANADVAITASQPIKYSERSGAFNLMQFVSTNLSGIEFGKLPKLDDATELVTVPLGSLNASDPPKWKGSLGGYNAYGFAANGLEVNYDGKVVMTVPGDGSLQFVADPSGNPIQVIYLGPEIDEDAMKAAIGEPINAKRLSFSVKLVDNVSAELIPNRRDYAGTAVDHGETGNIGVSVVSDDLSLVMNISNDGGVFRSTDGGKNYTKIAVANESNAYDKRQIRMSKDTSRVAMVLAYSNESLFVSNNSGVSWNAANVPSGHSFVSVAYDGSTLYGLAYQTSDWNVKLMKSENNGASWTVVRQNLGDTLGVDSTNTFNMISTGGDDFSVLVQNVSERTLNAFYTKDGGANWGKNVLDFNETQGAPLVNTVQSSSDGKVIVINRPDNSYGSWLSVDGGVSWKVVDGAVKMDKMGGLYRLIQDDYKGWVVESSNDQGNSWSKISNGELEMSANQVWFSLDAKYVVAPSIESGTSWYWTFNEG